MINENDRKRIIGNSDIIGVLKILIGALPLMGSEESQKINQILKQIEIFLIENVELAIDAMAILSLYDKVSREEELQL